MNPSETLDLLRIRQPGAPYTEAEMDAAASVYCSINGLLRLATRILEDGARFGWVDGEGVARLGYSGKGETVAGGISGGIHVFTTQAQYPAVPDYGLTAEFILSCADDPAMAGFLAAMLERVPTKSYLKLVGGWDRKAELYAYMEKHDPAESGLHDITGEASCAIRLTAPGAKSPLALGALQGAMT